MHDADRDGGFKLLEGSFALPVSRRRRQIPW